MEFRASPKINGENDSAVAGFGFPNYSKADRSELLGLMAQADLFRRQSEAYLVGLVIRFGELEGWAAAATVCHQLNISAHRARQLAKMAKGLAAMPAVLSAAEQGLISADQAGLVAESHKRAPMSDHDQQELVELGGWQGQDEFSSSATPMPSYLSSPNNPLSDPQARTAAVSSPAGWAAKTLPHLSPRRPYWSSPPTTTPLQGNSKTAG